MSASLTERAAEAIVGLVIADREARSSHTGRPLTAYVTAIADAEAALVRAVADRRATKVSWTAIGAELGITRQAAWERFRPAVEALQ